jgi:hypothetical protein
MENKEMIKPKLGKLAAFAGGALLSTKEAAADDDTGVAVYLERQRYERAVIDFEHEVHRRRDSMKSEHLENLRVIFGGDE